MTVGKRGAGCGKAGRFGGLGAHRPGRRSGAALLLWLCASPVLGWSSATELAIAEKAARFAPKDLERQIERHEGALRQGVLGAKRSPAVGRSLDAVLHDEIEGAIDAIRIHRPFVEIVERLGRVVHYVAAANDPLAVGNSDPAERRYRADYPRYVDSALPRFNVTFYGDGRELSRPEDLRLLLRRTFARGRAYYPMLGSEYRRIDFGVGARKFDDRSTAYGVSALAFSHAVSDSIGVLRYIWLRAGGADSREFLQLTPPTSGR